MRWRLRRGKGKRGRCEGSVQTCIGLKRWWLINTRRRHSKTQPPPFLSFHSFASLRLAGPWLFHSFNMHESWFQREFLVPRRLIFNILFYGSQCALFAYGWYSQVRHQPSLLRSFPDLAPSVRKHQVDSVEYPQVFRLDLSWRWSRP